MIATEFIEVTAELEGFFDKEYNNTQRKHIYEEFKELSKERYRQVVNESIRSCKYLPKLVELVEIEKGIPKESNVAEETKVKCDKCNSTGLVTYKKKIQDANRWLEYVYCARCNCANAENKSYLIPLASQIGI